jgi:hypothetical protein
MEILESQGNLQFTFSAKSGLNEVRGLVKSDVFTRKDEHDWTVKIRTRYRRQKYVVGVKTGFLLVICSAWIP